jgi:hypothetical protein
MSRYIMCIFVDIAIMLCMYVDTYITLGVGYNEQ